MKQKLAVSVKSLALAAGVFALSGQSFAEQANPISTGEMFATTCFQCHGSEGKYAGGTIPPLAGYPRDVMVQQLKDFKYGKRPATIMDRHMKGYTDAEIEAIADYIATLKP